MPSTRWRALGPGSILGTLRADMRKATREVMVVGPFIDDYFAEATVASCPSGALLRVLTRSPASVAPTFEEHMEAALARFRHRPVTEVRTLDRLHAKLMLVDETIVFCGSANWYRYSLEESLEVVLRGPVSDAPTLLDEVASLWDQAEVWKGERSSSRAHVPTPAARSPISDGFRAEVLDPIAAAKLASVRGAFVLGTKTTSRKARR
ncbi:phospholipase D-like domain-containing protein [Sorangium sp. So ce327]|uniref:phospholipase D-like domain-containing protein n=1 Tax=Sorangium sp. So ce327 TaxID=3133301 RepID=UPI003F5F944C